MRDDVAQQHRPLADPRPAAPRPTGATHGRDHPQHPWRPTTPTARRTPRMAGMLNGVINARYRRGGAVDRSTPPAPTATPEVPVRTIHPANIAHHSATATPATSPARSPPSAATRRPPSTICATRSAASIATLAARRGLVRSASGCASSSSGSTTDCAASRAKASNQAHLFKPIYSSASIQAHLIKRAQAA